MPNIKSAKKRVLISAELNKKNRATKTALKTRIKKFDTAVETGENTQEAYKLAISGIDKAAGKGVIHKNTAARKKSQLAAKMNAAQ